MRPIWLVCAALSACGGSVGQSAQPPDAPPDLTGLSAITVLPANSTVTIDQDTPATQAFTAQGHFMDGHTEDITGSVGWTLDNPSVGSMAGAAFTSVTAFGGRTQVVAHAGSVSGATSLTIAIKKRVVEGGTPSNPGGLFGGPAAPGARNPDLVYPNDGVLVPPNLGQLEIHFMPGAENTVFELSFANTITDVKVYLACTSLGAGCLYTPEAAVWSAIAGTNRGADPLTVSIKGTSDGSVVGSSASQSLAFALDDVKGAIYYWTTSGTSAIVRFDFDGGGTTGQPFLTGDGGPNTDPDSCIGCHALSRDGKKLIAERGWNFASQLFIYDVTQKTPMATPATTQRSWFESWSPDGSQYVGVCGPDSDCTDPNLLLIDGTTGALSSVVSVNATKDDAVDHPDWSPDGKSIVYMRPGLKPTTLQHPMNGAIEMVTNAGSGWSSPITVVARTGSKNRYYPAFSPDSAFIVFDESTCPAGKNSDASCDADSDPSARLWMVRAQASATPVALARANAGGKTDGTTTDLTSSFPKWSPFQYRRTASRPLLWLTFSSTRNFGLRPPPVPYDTVHNPKGSLVWMVAIDPEAAAAGADPSAAAFVLPFQDVGTSNHIAQWTSTTTPIP